MFFNAEIHTAGIQVLLAEVPKNPISAESVDAAFKVGGHLHAYRVNFGPFPEASFPKPVEQYTINELCDMARTELAGYIAANSGGQQAALSPFLLRLLLTIVRQVLTGGFFLNAN